MENNTPLTSEQMKEAGRLISEIKDLGLQRDVNSQIDAYSHDGLTHGYEGLGELAKFVVDLCQNVYVQELKKERDKINVALSIKNNDLDAAFKQIAQFTSECHTHTQTIAELSKENAELKLQLESIRKNGDRIINAKLSIDPESGEQTATVNFDGQGKSIIND